MNIAILDDYQEAAHEHADWSGLMAEHNLFVLHQHIDDPEVLIDVLEDMDIIGIMRERTPFPRALFEQLPKLKLLVTTGAQNAAIDLEAAADHGVTVCGTQSPGHAASELAFGLILSLARQIHLENQYIRVGEWQTTVGTDLRGQTLGVLGLGRHGGNLARFGQAFGMRVIAWSQNLTRQRCDELEVEYTEKERFFRESDFITIHLKMGKRNRGLVGKDELALMKPSAYLVNTSRGPIIDETALIEALDQDLIGGAGLDVYDQEPLPEDHPLLQAPNCVLTPHLGYVTHQTYEVFYGQTVEAIEAWLAGNPVRVLNAK